MMISPIDTSSVLEQTYNYESETLGNDNRGALASTAESPAKATDNTENKNASSTSSQQNTDTISISETARKIQQTEASGEGNTGQKNKEGGSSLSGVNIASSSNASNTDSKIESLRKQLKAAQAELTKAQAELAAARSETSTSKPNRKRVGSNEVVAKDEDNLSAAGANKPMQDAIKAYEEQMEGASSGRGSEQDSKLQAAISKISAAAATVQGINSQLQAAIQEQSV